MYAYIYTLLVYILVIKLILLKYVLFTSHELFCFIKKKWSTCTCSLSVTTTSWQIGINVIFSLILCPPSVIVCYSLYRADQGWFRKRCHFHCSCRLGRGCSSDTGSGCRLGRGCNSDRGGGCSSSFPQPGQKNCLLPRYRQVQSLELDFEGCNGFLGRCGFRCHT